MFPGTAPKNVRESRRQRLAAAIHSGAVRRLDPGSVSVERRQPVEQLDPVFDKIARRIQMLQERRKATAYGETADDALRVALRLADEVRKGGK